MDDDEVFRLTDTRQAALITSARRAGHRPPKHPSGERLLVYCERALSFGRARPEETEGFSAASELLYHLRKGEIVSFRGGEAWLS